MGSKAENKRKIWKRRLRIKEREKKDKKKREKQDRRKIEKERKRKKEKYRIKKKNEKQRKREMGEKIMSSCFG